MLHANNSPVTLLLHEYNDCCGSGLNAPAGTLGHLYNLYIAYAMLTVVTIQKLGYGSSVQYVGPLAARRGCRG